MDASCLEHPSGSPAVGAAAPARLAPARLARKLKQLAPPFWVSEFQDDAREREQQERVRLQVHELKDQWERRKDDPAHRDKPNRVFAMQAYLELCQLREENNDSLCWEHRSLQDYLGAIPHIPRLTAQTQNR